MFPVLCGDSVRSPPHYFLAVKGYRARQERSGPVSTMVVLPIVTGFQGVPTPGASFPDLPERSGLWCRG